jgi:hypothetical protein
MGLGKRSRRREHPESWIFGPKRAIHRDLMETAAKHRPPILGKALVIAAVVVASAVSALGKSDTSTVGIDSRIAAVAAETDGVTWYQTDTNRSSGLHRFGWGAEARENCWPITGDWDGDRKTSVGLACPSADGWMWYQTNANRSGGQQRFGWGAGSLRGCKPITGDWDGDRKTSVGLACPSADGWMWYQTNANRSGGQQRFGWGAGSLAYCRPITGDWNGDALDSVGLTCQWDRGWEWYQANANRSGGQHRFGWGAGTLDDYLPITGDWNGDGKSSVGISSAHGPLPPPPPRPANCNRVTGPVGFSQTTMASGFRVHACLADRVNRLVAAARRDGLRLSGWGWRSTESQIELRRQHCGTSYYAIYEKPSSQCNPPTARPGSSMHERGLALDFSNCSSRSTSCWRWLNQHAASYGLYNLPSEPWHWSTNGR